MCLSPPRCRGPLCKQPCGWGCWRAEAEFLTKLFVLGRIGSAECGTTEVWAGIGYHVAVQLETEMVPSERYEGGCAIKRVSAVMVNFIIEHLAAKSAREKHFEGGWPRGKPCSGRRLASSPGGRSLNDYQRRLWYWYGSRAQHEGRSMPALHQARQDLGSEGRSPLVMAKSRACL